MKKTATRLQVYTPEDIAQLISLASKLNPHNYKKSFQAVIYKSKITQENQQRFHIDGLSINVEDN